MGKKKTKEKAVANVYFEEVVGRGGDTQSRIRTSARVVHDHWSKNRGRGYSSPLKFAKTDCLKCQRSRSIAGRFSGGGRRMCSQCAPDILVVELLKKTTL